MRYIISFFITITCVSGIYQSITILSWLGKMPDWSVVLCYTLLYVFLFGQQGISAKKYLTFGRDMESTGYRD